MTIYVDLFDMSRIPADQPGGWALSTPLQVAELEALAARARRSCRRAVLVGAVLAPIAAGLAFVAPLAAAVVGAVAGERSGRALRCWRAGRRYEVEAMVRQLGAGPAAGQPASTAAARRGWRAGAGSRQ